MADKKFTKQLTTYEPNVTLGIKGFDLLRPNAEMGVSTSNSQYAVVGLRDKNNKYCSYIQMVDYANGTTSVQLTSRNYQPNSNTNTQDNSLVLFSYPDGNRGVGVSDKKIWRIGIGGDSNGVFPIEVGGTGADNATDALSNLGWGYSTTTVISSTTDETNNWHGGLMFQKWGKIVQMSPVNNSYRNWPALKEDKGPNSYIILQTNGTQSLIPTGYRPNYTVMGGCFMNNSSASNRDIAMRVDTNGQICLYTGSETIPGGMNLWMSAIWFTN